MNLRSVKVRPAAVTEGNGYPNSEQFFKRVFKHLTKAWYHSQIGHRSEYSVERLLAFRDYYHRTSIAHAVAVCILTPIPAVLVTLLIDCIPLRPPSDGWTANDALWVRLGLDALVVAFGHASRVGEVVVVGTVSTFKAVFIAIGTSLGCVAMSIGVAAAWKFPIPFGYVLLDGPYALIFWVVTVLAIGPRLLVKAPLLRGQLKSHLLIVFAEGLMATVYPIFIGIFYRLTEAQQIVAVFVLPVIKLITKKLIANAASELQECLGLVVVFSVDVFNVFFTAICMQVSKSTVSTLLMIASDCFHMLVALRAIFNKVNVVKKQRNYETTEIRQPLDYFRDLPGMIREVFGDSEISKARSCRIRVFAPFPLNLSDESIAFMNDIARTRRYVHIYSSSVIQLSDQSRRESISRGRATGRLSEIGGVGALTKFTESKMLVPLNQRQERPMRKQSLHLLLKARFASRKGSAPRRLLTLMHSDTKIASHTLRAVLSHSTTEEAVWDALQVHFHSEYLLMTEYVECTLPILYVVYLLVLSQLPAAPYYPNVASLTTEQLTKTIASLMIFSVVELSGFLGLLVLLRERFGFLPLYQLAFVLETQARTLQGHLLIWTVFIFHLPLVHYGVNFDA